MHAKNALKTEAMNSSTGEIEMLIIGARAADILARVEGATATGPAIQQL